MTIHLKTRVFSFRNYIYIYHLKTHHIDKASQDIIAFFLLNIFSVFGQKLNAFFKYNIRKQHTMHKQDSGINLMEKSRLVVI